MSKTKNRAQQTRTATNVAEERRAFPRRPASELTFLKSVRLLAGPEVCLVDVSRGGALLESETPLPPGTRICIRLVTTDTTLLIAGRVLRSRVSCLQPGLVRYRSAVQFDEEVALFSKERRETAAEVAASGVSQEPAGMMPDSAISIVPDSIASGNVAEYLTVTAIITDKGPDLRHIFGINDW